jgi:hypothetical protein
MPSLLFWLGPENRCDQVASGRFQPGVSGNPGGRPKELGHVRDLAREHTDEAIRTLASIMRDDKEPAPARVRAAEALLDRGWGRAETTANVKVPTNVRDLSTEELLALIADYEATGDERGEGDHGNCIDRLATKQVMVC